jgi:response regulator RpfG family c-di-GMP phosphodiesterase
LKNQLRFLLIDDDNEISDLLCLYLSVNFGASFTIASNGDSAIEILKNDLEFDLIFCDFRMTQGSGLDVFEYLEREQLNIPFVLVTSDKWESHPEFHNKNNVGYVEKPFDDEKIISEANRLLPNIDAETLNPSNYVPISIDTLFKIQKINCKLFIRLNETKFVKIQNGDTQFAENEYRKIKAKGVDQLFIEKNEFKVFLEDFRKKVVNDMLFMGFQSDPDEALKIAGAVQEMANSLSKNFGISKDAQELTKKNIQLVQSIIDRNHQLNSLFTWALDSTQGYSYQHSVLICILTGEITRNIDLGNPFASEILSLAAFLHDAGLSDYQVKNEERFIQAIKSSSKMNLEDLAAIIDHSKKSHQSVSQWQHCPPEVLEIIKNHHEKPDGTGFPNGLTAIDINPITACFIVCEDLAKLFLEIRNSEQLLQEWKKNETRYNQAPFVQFYKFLLNSFSLLSTAKTPA